MLLISCRLGCLGRVWIVCLQRSGASRVTPLSQESLRGHPRHHPSPLGLVSILCPAASHCLAIVCPSIPALGALCPQKPSASNCQYTVPVVCWGLGWGLQTCTVCKEKEYFLPIQLKLLKKKLSGWTPAAIKWLRRTLGVMSCSVTAPPDHFV